MAPDEKTVIMYGNMPLAFGDNAQPSVLSVNELAAPGLIGLYRDGAMVLVTVSGVSNGAVAGYTLRGSDR